MSITEWRQKDLIAEVSGRVLSGMDRACAFAAERARGNAPRRTGQLAEGSDYEVQPERANVVGRVGVKSRQGGGKAFWGYFVELGTSKMAARPFLRPAIFDNAEQIVKLIAEG